jgi:hypothetical protein
MCQHQIQRRRTKLRNPRPAELDLRTPSGRQLPY